MNNFNLREPSPNWDRVRKTVAHKEPDRIPLLEALVEYPIMSRFLGREVKPDDLEARVEFWYKAGYDGVPVTASMMAFGKVTDESPISKVIKERMLRSDEDRADESKWNLEQTSFIHDRKDFENFPWEALEQYDLADLNKVQAYLPDGMKIIANSGKIFTLTWMLMGFNNFGTKLLMDEELVSDVFAKIATIQLKLLDQIFDTPNIGAVWLVDDMAFGNGPIISPDSYRKFVFPWYAKIVKKCHENDILVFQHSDGDLTTIIPDMIDYNIDLLHPIDPTCMSMKKVKQDFGDKLAFAGNVANEMLRSGTPEEIDQRVKYLARTMGPGGGVLPCRRKFSAGLGNV